MDAGRKAISRETAEALNKTKSKVKWHSKPREKKNMPRMMKKCTFRSLPNTFRMEKNRKKIHLSNGTTNKPCDKKDEGQNPVEAQTPLDHACVKEQVKEQQGWRHPVEAPNRASSHSREGQRNS
jgi:hypothetical protein